MDILSGRKNREHREDFTYQKAISSIFICLLVNIKVPFRLLFIRVTCYYYRMYNSYFVKIFDLINHLI